MMLRRAWKPVALTTVLIGTPSYLYYNWKQKQQSFDLAVKVRGEDGKAIMTHRTIPLLSKDAVEQRLSENAVSETKPRPDGIVWKHTTASLASNDPVEDASSDAIVQRDPGDPSAPGDLLFFTVMDGHGGPHTSRLLSKILINAVLLEISLLIHGSKSDSRGGFLESLKSLFRFSSVNRAAHAADSPDISLAIQSAFTKLDAELINAPIAVLAAHLSKDSTKKDLIPDLSQHPMALQTMLPAVSGSCALMAVFDTAHRDLYIACTGDSRAVAGCCEQAADGTRWRVEVLSEDQTGRNPNEAKRIQSEHPADEAEDVIRGGRILGGLEPTRAFGDARYKWPREVQEILSQVFLVGNNRPLNPRPPSFKTPPYVTATPVVTHRKLSFLPSAQRSTEDNPTLRFLVLATDGLWDKLSSEEVVALVGGHFAGIKGSVPKSTLFDRVPVTSGTAAVEGKEKRSRERGGSWAFRDDNVSTHLIRNALAGADESTLRRLLSIPAPHSRRFRDDITVTVIWWEDGREEDAKRTVISSQQIKAKL